MAEARFETLKREIRAYGEAAFQNLLRSRGLADEIIKGFPAYIGCAPENVTAVPADGPFDPHKDYGEAAFSFHDRRVVILEPVRFGLALVVGNVEDSGALWLRTSVSIEVAGEFFDIFIAEQPRLRAPLDFEGKLEPVFETIFEDFLGIFTIEVMEFNDSRFRDGIGFLPG